jgi:uncharacterized protein YraI
MERRTIVAAALLASCLIAAPSLAFDVEHFAVVTGTANVRSGPGTGYPVMTRYEEGRRVRVLETSGGWFRIEMPRPGTGWIYGPLLRPEADRPAVRQALFTLLGLPPLLPERTPSERQAGPLCPGR